MILKTKTAIQTPHREFYLIRFYDMVGISQIVAIYNCTCNYLVSRISTYGFKSEHIVIILFDKRIKN